MKDKIDMRLVFLDIAKTVKNGYHGQFIISVQGGEIKSVIFKESKDLRNYTAEAKNGK
jgi:hypothetical protein